MPIIDIQRRIAEVGRIRIGQLVATSSGRGKGSKRPAKLDTFRLTSPNRTRVEQAARLYGGDVAEWEAPAGKQFEVITKTDVLPVIVPPSDMAFSQWYETWSGGGCLRRCDGQTESIGDQPCVCDPAARECDIHTRLSVMLRDMPGLGLWRLDTSGTYAALELQGAVDVMRMAAAAGTMLPAQLRLEQRMIKRADEQTKRFAVPVLDVEISPAQLLGGPRDALDIGTLSIEPARVEAHLTPVPASVQERPAPPVAEQATATKTRKPRKNAATKIPPTGVKPRTAAQAAQKMPPPPDDEDSPALAQGQAIAEAEQRRAIRDGDVLPEPAHSPTDSNDRAKMNRQMHALFRKAGIEKDRREDRLNITAYISKQYDIQSSNDLDDAALQKVCDRMAGWDRDGLLDENINELLNTIAIDKSRGEGQ